MNCPTCNNVMKPRTTVPPQFKTVHECGCGTIVGETQDIDMPPPIRKIHYFRWDKAMPLGKNTKR